MTTVAYKAGIMACDSCWTAMSGEQQTSENKIVRLAGGALLGQAGDNDSRSVVALFENVKTEKQLPSRAALAGTFTSFAGILVLPSGKVFLIDITCQSEEHGTYSGQVWPAGRRGIAGIGAGGHIALGAMAAGKTAREAVAIACDFDINSRLPVHEVELKPRPRQRAANR